ncbi:MAG: ATP-binding cassette domain-containing protein [Gammaproteobacteria bacterium]|nr:ATP-binding cassette domain-containing protein [Gammaproteobacteria bacterium]
MRSAPASDTGGAAGADFTSAADPVTGILPLKLEKVGLDLPGHVNALRDVSLTLERDGLCVVLGPNGAGKTLLLKICHGLLRADRGSVRWSGGTGDGVRRGQAMVLQRPVLLRRSVRGNVEYALRLQGIGGTERIRRSGSALALARLEHVAQRPARSLSGGEQQRVALARAWATQPEVLFLDEPSTHLDPIAARDVERMIADIRAAGTTIVMTTHDLGQAHRLADRILFLHRGRLLEQQPAAEFFRRQQSPEARAFLQGELLG